MSDVAVKLICKTVVFVAALCFAGFSWKRGWEGAGFFGALIALISLF